MLLSLCPLLPLPSSQKFYDQGRAVRCVPPIGGGEVLHLVVLYGYQGADNDSEQLGVYAVS